MSEGLLAAAGQLWKHKLFSIAGVQLSLGSMLVALILLLFASKLSKLVARIFHNRIIVRFVHDKGLQNTYQTFIFYAAFVGLVCLSLTVAGIPLTIFTVVGGALAIGVGFGSQNIVNNFISGIILMVEQPVKIGDIVDVDGMSGSILGIGTRSTKIKTPENKIYIIPNSFFLEKSVLNWTFGTSVLRNNIDFGVAYGSDVNLVKKVCLEILDAHIDVETNPVPYVLFNDFGDSNLSFRIVYFNDLAKIKSQPETKSELRFLIDQKFRENKIEMAFPQRDLHLKMNRPFDVKVLS